MIDLSRDGAVLAGGFVSLEGFVPSDAPERVERAAQTGETLRLTTFDRREEYEFTPRWSQTLRRWRWETVRARDDVLVGSADTLADAVAAAREHHNGAPIL